MTRFVRSGRSLFALLVLSSTVSVRADGNGAPRTMRSAMSDGAYIATSPARIRLDDLPWIGAAAGAIGGAALLDRTVRGRLEPHSRDRSVKRLRTVGDVGQALGPIAGTAFAVHGALTGSETSKETAFLAYETYLWAGLAEAVMKPVIGRARPFSTEDPFHFRAGRVNGAFPSGHTTAAFAGATVLAEQYPRWAVVLPAYGLAGLVAYSRLAANQHWLSDVVVGAILGSVVSHAVRRRRRDPAPAWRVQTNGTDIEIVHRFG